MIKGIKVNCVYMGFMKKQLELNNFKRKGLEKLLETEGACRHCDSYYVKYTKHIGYGKKMGVVYHYKLHCKTCGKTYHIKRTKAVFEKVKNQKWIESKSFKINKP